MFNNVYNILFDVLSMAENNQAQEAWNMATETLKRLSRCMDLCSFFSQKGDLVNWFSASMDWRRNLITFLEDNEVVILENKFAEMPKGWSNGGKVRPDKYSQAHKVLDELYIMMSKYMKAKGLLMPKSKDPRAAVLNM